MRRVTHLKVDISTSHTTAGASRSQEERRAQVFGLGEVAKLVGTPLSRLKDWTIGRPFAIKPSIRSASGTGSRNLFDLEDTYLIALVNRLSEGGLSSRVIQGVLDIIEQTPKRAALPNCTGLIIEVKKGQVVTLDMFAGTEGRELFLGHESRTVLGRYSVDLRGLWKEVDERIERLSKRARRAARARES